MHKPKVVTLIALTVIALYLFQAGYHGAVWMGEKWYTHNAQDTWWMNPSMPFMAQHAYDYFAITAFVLSGVFFGLGILTIYKLIFAACSLSRRKKWAAIAGIATLFIAGGLLMALGFNTFDWMVSYVTGQGGQPNTFTLWNFNLPFISIDGWNFYAYCVLAPLWISGCLITGAIYVVAFCRKELL